MGQFIQHAEPEDGYDEFGFDEMPEELTLPEEAPAEPHIPLREQFPPAGSDYLGGASDGWEYRTVFGGAKLAYTYEMVKQFLQDEGYGDVPLPVTAEDLKLFRKPRDGQLQMFAERGYVQNPVKLLFSNMPGQRSSIIVCIYNELAPDHLLRFHGIQRP